jgi:methylenetetrahydrofolate dehydrogenase (NADP+)/methenyltetrahydrofolate cyclohydrolase
MVKKDSIIIDCGSVKNTEIDQPNVMDLVKWITPVPGGVGPLSIAFLGVNVLKAAALQRGLGFSEKELKFC